MSHVSVFTYLLVKVIIFLKSKLQVFVITKAVSNIGICIVKAVL